MPRSNLDLALQRRAPNPARAVDDSHDSGRVCAALGALRGEERSPRPIPADPREFFVASVEKGDAIVPDELVRAAEAASD
jgi:hypothetical protein